MNFRRELPLVNFVPYNEAKKLIDERDKLSHLIMKPLLKFRCACLD